MPQDMHNPDNQLALRWDTINNGMTSCLKILFELLFLLKSCVIAAHRYDHEVFLLLLETSFYFGAANIPDMPAPIFAQLAPPSEYDSRILANLPNVVNARMMPYEGQT